MSMPPLPPELERLHAKRLSLMSDKVAYLRGAVAELEAGDEFGAVSSFNRVQATQRLIDATDRRITAARLGRRYRVARRRGGFTWA